MMKEYFENILREVVRASLRKEPVPAELLTQDALEHYPKHLYKYKSLDDKRREKSIQMINEEYLWAAHPIDFVDPTDSRINVSDSEMKYFGKWLEKHYAEFVFFEMPPRGVMEGEKYGTTLQEMIRFQEEYSGEKGKSKTAILKGVLDKADISESMKKQIMNSFKRITHPDNLKKMSVKMLDEYKKLISSFQRASLVASVTTSYQNMMLWENYADQYSGMVIEYTIPPYEQLNDEIKQMLLHLFPVKYLKRIPKVSMIPLFEGFFRKEYYKQDVDYCDSAVQVYKQLFYKRSTYSGECEWRFVDCVNTNKIPLPFVSRVIAGYRTESTILSRLKEVCDNKGIELLVQKNDELKSELQYVK